jgi:hypothetical protein
MFENFPSFDEKNDVSYCQMFLPLAVKESQILFVDF